MAGRALKWVEPRLPSPVLLSAAALAVSAVLIAVVPMTPLDLKNGVWGLPLLGVLIAVMISSALILLASRLPVPRFAAGPILALASVAIAVVLFHPYFIWLLRPWGVPFKAILFVAVVSLLIVTEIDYIASSGAISAVKVGVQIVGVLLACHYVNKIVVCLASVTKKALAGVFQISVSMKR